MRITEEEMEDRKEHMIHVAYQLFNEHGIDAVSLEKIAVTAGVSLKTLTRYFNSKARLVEQTQVILWKEIVDCITAGTRDARLKTANGLEELEIALRGFEILYKKHSDFIFFYYDYQSYLIRKHIKLSESHIEWMLADVRPVFLHALQRGQADGSISTEAPPAEHFILIWGVIRYYVERLVIHYKLYEGENPWVLMFPRVMEEVLKMVKA